MSWNLEEYLDALDRLRIGRARDLGRELETQITDELDAIHARLTSDERDEAESAWWRAWPDEYWRRINEAEGPQLISSALELRDHHPPRAKKTVA